MRGFSGGAGACGPDGWAPVRTFGKIVETVDGGF